MTTTTHSITIAPCDQCGAPLDEQQRYCVVCGASRHHPHDPLAAFLGTRRARPATPVIAAPPRRADRRWIAGALALLPVAAAVGVLVGKGGSGDDAAVLAALRAQKAPVVQVGSGAATAGTTAATAAAPSKKKAATAKHAAKGGAAAQAKAAVALQRHPTASQKVTGKKVVAEIQRRKGKSYVDQQRNLPDTIVVP